MTISSPGPIESIHVSEFLRCQAVSPAVFATGWYYSGSSTSNPESCGTWIAVDGVLYSSDDCCATGAASGLPYTPISQTGVLGSGTSADPFRVVTEVGVGATGIRIIQTDSYVTGRSYFSVDIKVVNDATEGRSIQLWRAADCYVGGSDSGYGYVDIPAGIAACTTEQGGASGVVVYFQAFTEGAHVEVDFYGSIWSNVGALQMFDDTCNSNCASSQDNGAGVSWAFTVAAGGESTHRVAQALGDNGIAELQEEAEQGEEEGGEEEPLPRPRSFYPDPGDPLEWERWFGDDDPYNQPDEPVEEPAEEPVDEPEPTPDPVEPEQQPDDFFDDLDDLLPPKILFEKGGASLSAMDALDGVIDLHLSGSPYPPERIRWIVETSDGTFLVPGDGASAPLDTSKLPPGWFKVKALLVSLPFDGGGYAPLAGERVLAERDGVIVRADAEPAAAVGGVVTGIAVVAAGGFGVQAVWGRIAMLLGEAGREGAIAVGEDRLRGRAVGVAMSAGGLAAAHGAVAAKRRRRSWIAFLVAVVMLAVFFALEGAGGLDLAAFAASLPVIGLCAAFFFTGQFGMEWLLARLSGAQARFRFLWAGAASLVLSVLVFKVAFGYPGFVDEDDDELTRRLRRMKGFRALGVFGLMLGLLIAFVAAGRYWDFAFYTQGMTIGLVALATSTLPVPPLPGGDVWRYRPLLSLAAAAGALYLFFAFHLAWMTPIAFAWVGLGGLALFVVVGSWIMVRTQQPAWYLRAVAWADRVDARVQAAKPAWWRRIRERRAERFRRLQAKWEDALGRTAVVVANRVRRRRGEAPLVYVRR